MFRMGMTGCGILALVVCAAPALAAINFAGNGGFEIAGANGPADSAQWNEFTSFATGISERTTTNAQTGSYAHHLYAIGQPGAGAVAGILQHSGNDAGQPSLAENTTLNASFDGLLPLGPSAVLNFAVRILNNAGGIVDQYQTTIPVANAAYTTFTSTDLTVPAFGPAPNDAFYAFIDINLAVGADDVLFGEAFIDNVQINGTLVPEPASALLLVLGAAAVIRRR